MTTLNILVFEDPCVVKAIMDLFKFFLERQGDRDLEFRIFVVESGGQALKLLDQGSVDFAIIGLEEDTMDLAMLAIDQNIPLIALSVFSKFKEICSFPPKSFFISKVTTEEDKSMDIRKFFGALGEIIPSCPSFYQSAFAA